MRLRDWMKRMENESGVALIEFALFMPMFVLMLAGVTDYAFLIQAKIRIQEAAAAGAAYGTIPGNYNKLSAIALYTKFSAVQFAGTMNVNAVDVYSCSPGGSATTAMATCNDGGSPLMFVQVTTSVNVPTPLRWIGIPSSMTLQGFASYEVPWAAS